MKERINNQKGIALVFALLMVTISLALILGVLYLITRGGISVSSLTRQYHSVKEAAYGGAEFTAQELIARAAPGTVPLSTLTYGGTVTPLTSDACFSAKIINPQANQISPVNWGGLCPAGADSINLDPAGGGSSDFRIQLPATASQAPYTVFVKVVGSAKGNTDLSGLNLVNPSKNPGSKITSIPYIYRVEILAQRSNNPAERMSLSGLLVY